MFYYIENGKYVLIIIDLMWRLIKIKDKFYNNAIHNLYWINVLKISWKRL